MKHATTTRDGYTVPLIGIPAEATQEQCARCKKICWIAAMILDENGKPCCKMCSETDENEP